MLRFMINASDAYLMFCVAFRTHPAILPEYQPSLLTISTHNVLTEDSCVFWR